ncbi:MAG: helix-turn-helix domain-containing protein [Oscillospiraceae bacterium]|nr:helix-turn-helix domain-containing protein [Oscillospiraceae bacterium]
MDIMDRITERLKEINRTQADICNYIGINYSVFTTWKKRGTEPPTKYLIKICEFLNLSLNYLLTGEEKPEISTEKEQEMLNLFRRLPNDEQSKLIGRTELLVEMNTNKSADT